MSDLENCLRTLGARIDLVSPQTSGLWSRSSIKQHEEVLFIPRVAILTDSDALYHPEIQKIVKTPTNGTGLAVLLLHHRALGSESPMQSYINSLPNHFPTVPLYSKGNLADLQGSMCWNMIITCCRRYHAEYLQLLDPPFDLADFSWAKTVVLLKGVGCNVNGHFQVILAPLADKTNHSSTPNVQCYYEDRTEGLRMVANHHLPQGVQLLENFGVKCNSRYFLNYGFALENNHNFNQAEIFLTTPGQSANYDNGYSGHSDNQPDVSRFQVPTVNAANSCWDRELLAKLFACARTGTVSPKTFSTWQIEKKALATLATACSHRLRSFQHSRVEHLVLRETFDRESLEWHLHTVVAGEQQVLEFYLELSELVQNTPDVDCPHVLYQNDHFSAYYQFCVDNL